MKKVFFSIISLVLILLYSCSKEEMVQQEQINDLKSLTCDKDGLHLPKGPVFTVYPNGTDDTQALIQAFDDAKAAGPGANVKLVEGIYYTSTIEVRDFFGYFTGAGKGKSEVLNVPDLPCEEDILADLTPTMFRFVGGEMKISNMTMRTQDGRPCAFGPLNDAYLGDLNCILILADKTTSYIPPNPYIRAVVENVDFIGGYDDNYGIFATDHNVGMIIWCGGDPGWNYSIPIQYSKGDFVIRGCKFDHSLDPEVFGLADESTVLIENNVFENNLMNLFTIVNLDVKFTIRNNLFKNGLWNELFIDEIYQEWLAGTARSNRCVYSITGNKFISSEGVTSVYLGDYRRLVYPDEGLPNIYIVKDNVFETKSGGTGIQGMFNVDAKIWNNKFSGTGAVGIMLDGNEATNTWAENNKVMANNFTGATYTDAAVLLGAYTKNCTVVGVPSDLVADLGVNNKVIGVKAQKKGPHYRGMQGHLKSMQETIMRMRPSKPQ